MKTIFKVKQFLETNRLVKSGDNVLLAVSGGPDSMVLLDIMRNISKIMKFKIGVAHINHQIRPDSHKDLKFVDDECKRLNIPFYGREIFIFGAKKSQRKSLEQIAREQRYNALFSIAQEFGYNLIATGHTKTDQAETVLMRIISGTSIRSLSGILVKRDQMIIRPLLSLSRSEVMEYAKENNIKFVEDTTNRDKRYLRNRIRLELMPFIKKEFNPSIEDALCSIAEDAVNLRSILTDRLSPFLEKVRYDEDSSIATFSRSDFLLVPQELRRYFLLEILSNIDVSKRIDSDNLRSAIDLILSAQGSRFYRLSPDFVIRCEYDQISVGRIPHIQDIFSELENYEPVKVKKEGTYKIPWVDVEISFESGRKENNNYPQLFLSLEKFGFPFHIRIFEDGDRIYSKYYRKNIKLKKIFINRKIPIRIRKVLPIITSGEEILWVPGIIRSGIGRPEKGDEIITITVYNFEPELVKYLGPLDERDIIW
ncbi:MAG: tRNA lysidine(34) synthetase TilS [Deltaproteobacteria bacterium]|nr:tRNA lysidine(34) synthetase TilS [Deltaproteobacteria bacterium]